MAVAGPVGKQERRGWMATLPERGSPDYVPMLGAVLVLALALFFSIGLVTSGASGLLGGGGEKPVAAPTADNLPTATVPAAGEPSRAATGTPPTVPAEPVAAPPVVCLDVGHGGEDLGKVLLSGDGGEILYQEKDLVLDQALGLRDRLEAQGVRVVLTRETDTEVNPDYGDVNGDGLTVEDEPRHGELDELQARVNICNEAGADLLVSMHINGAANLDLQGYEAWWAKNRPDSDRSQWFAERVTADLGEQFAAAGFETPFRGALDDTQTEFPPSEEPGTFQNFVVLSPDVPERRFIGSTMPGVIVESLFLSNADDAAFVTTATGEEAVIAAYEEAILAYFAEFPEPVANDPPGTPPTGARTGEARASTQASVGLPVPAPPAPNLPPRLAPPPDPGTGSSQVVDGGTGDRREIALTFDAGEDRGYTAEILDLLKEQGILASFGITGFWAEQNPDLVRRMVAEGHQVFNHTYSHRSFTGFSTPWNPEDPGSVERMSEIQRTDEIVSEITGGYDMKPYFRPPYGDVGPQSLQDIAAAGYYLTVMWTCDSNGWNGWTPAETVQHCLNNIEPGGIILLHVGQNSVDYEALPALVEALKAEDYAFVTVERLLQT